jgi:hypothetical protein
MSVTDPHPGRSHHVRKPIAIVTALGTIALVVVLVGCGGSADPVELPHEAPAEELGSLAGTVLGAKTAANRDAVRRLAAAPVPPGSHRVSHLPQEYGLSGPEFAPVSPNLIRKEATFLTKLDPAEAFAWLKAHPPPKAGAQRLLTSGGERDYTSQTVGFQWGNSRAANGRNQYDTVVNRPAGGAAIRIEAQAIWIRPRPKAARMLQPGGPESCEELGEYPHHLVLTFRAAGGSVLAAAEQELPVGNCQLLGLTVEGKKLEPVEPSRPLIGRALKRLGVKAGQKG